MQRLYSVSPEDQDSVLIAKVKEEAEQSLKENKRVKFIKWTLGDLNLDSDFSKTGSVVSIEGIVW